jgi:hypothetical protein
MKKVEKVNVSECKVLKYIDAYLEQAIAFISRERILEVNVGLLEKVEANSNSSLKLKDNSFSIETEDSKLTIEGNVKPFSIEMLFLYLLSHNGSVTLNEACTKSEECSLRKHNLCIEKVT